MLLSIIVFSVFIKKKMTRVLNEPSARLENAIFSKVFINRL